VMLSQLESGQGGISVTVDEEATKRELESTFVSGHKVDEGEVGYVIEFIADGGEVLKEVKGVSASSDVSSASSYTRAKITFTRESADGFENFYCWTQPVFTDGRQHYDHD
jgi:hypothetical protein